MSAFLGHREFFKGLAIDKTDYDWKPHAVVHFNWGRVDPSSVENFDRTFAPTVKMALTEAGYAYDETKAPSTNLDLAIQHFYAKDGVGPAILIDEYDDPVAKSLKDSAHESSYARCLSFLLAAHAALTLRACA